MKSRSREDVALAARIGSRIRDIRRQRHLTQVELAERVGIRAGPMNAIENGRHVPTGRVLIGIASSLGVSVDALVGAPPPEGYVVEEGGVKGAPAAVLLPALYTPSPGPRGARMADDLVRATLALEDLCGATKRAEIPLYLPCSPTDAGMNNLAVRVRHLLGIGQAVVWDYLEVLENAGLRVIFCRLPEKCESLACADYPNGNAAILIRQGMTSERQMFRLVFELGRIYLDARRRMGPSTEAAPGEGTPLDEAHAARRFAAVLLMPPAGIWATVTQLGIRPDAWTYELLLRIKHRFAVSAESFAIRLEELGLIAPPLSAEFKRRIRAYYRATGGTEPGGSPRKLNYNARLSDLISIAIAKPETRESARDILRQLRDLNISLDPITLPPRPRAGS